MTEETRAAIERVRPYLDTDPEWAATVLHALEEVMYLGLTSLNDLPLLIELLEM